MRRVLEGGDGSGSSKSIVLTARFKYPNVIDVVNLPAGVTKDQTMMQHEAWLVEGQEHQESILDEVHGAHLHWRVRSRPDRKNLASTWIVKHGNEIAQNQTDVISQFGDARYRWDKIVPGKEFCEEEWVYTLVNLIDALLPEKRFDPAKQPFDTIC